VGDARPTGYLDKVMDGATMMEHGAPYMTGKKVTFVVKLVVACMILFVSGSAAEADVIIQPNGVCGANCTTFKIALSGTIDDQTLDAFEHAAADSRVGTASRDYGPLVTVTLNSSGGSVAIAMQIGQYIRQRGYFTGVFQGQQCASACVLILAAGVRRFATSGRIGIHRPRFNEEQFASLSLDEANARYNEMSTTVGSYLQKMGLPEKLFETMMSISSEKIRYLRPSETHDLGLDGEDAAWSEWRRAKDIQRFGREDYEVQRKYMAVLLQCSNEPRKDPDVCARELAPQFTRELEQCSSAGSDRVVCAQAISDKLLLRYR
jgi:ATP-dependent protease ClpP protease subunit